VEDDVFFPFVLPFLFLFIQTHNRRLMSRLLPTDFSVMRNMGVALAENNMVEEG
jgi:hypothetical protein